MPLYRAEPSRCRRGFRQSALGFSRLSQFPHVFHRRLVSIKEPAWIDFVSRTTSVVNFHRREQCSEASLQEFTGSTREVNNPSAAAVRRFARVPVAHI